MERRLGVRPEEVAAVGDSVSDIAMFRAARLGIAFRPSAARVAEAATHVVTDGGLTALLPLLLGGGQFPAPMTGRSSQ
jgi:phosphoserine phosphatase